MSNLSGVTNFFSTANEGFSTALAGTISAGATTVGLQSTTGLVDGSVFVGIIEPGTANQQVFTGTVSLTGSAIVNVVWTRGANTNHANGVTIVDYVTGTDFNMMSAGIQVEHAQSGKHTAAAAVTLGKLLWPIGAVYIETTGTNPSTTFGFGTWVAYGAGRTMLGVGTSDATYAAGATGGESTHTLIQSEMPSHTHPIEMYPNSNENGAYGLSSASTGFAGRAMVTAASNFYGTDATGGGGAHNNLPPYIVTYFWKRTA